jgi:hypothetical protein
VRFGRLQLIIAEGANVEVHDGTTDGLAVVGRRTSVDHMVASVARAKFMTDRRGSWRTP